MTILANLANISIRLGYRQIFENAALTINEGDKIGVLGLNGHGKSTLFKILIDELAPDKTQPAFIYDKNSELSFFHVPQEIDLTDGHLSSELFFYTFYPHLDKLRVQLDEVNQRLETEYMDQKVLDLQQRLLEEWEFSGIDNIYSQYTSYLKNFKFTQFDVPVSKLSGGEKRKIALALGLSANQKVILWDEPTNHLDLQTIEKFESELTKSSKTFLLITHDRELLHQVTNRVVHIASQAIRTFQGSYQDYLVYLQDQELHRQKEEERMKNHLRRETAWLRQGVQARRTRSKKRLQGYHDLKDGLSDLKSKQAKTMSLSISQNKVKTKKLLEGIDFKVSYGDHVVLKPSNFIIPNNAKIALMGQNGSGKSSLVKALLGLVEYEGTIKKKDDLLVTHFSQEMDIPGDMTPYEFVGEGLEMLQLPSGKEIHIYSYLDDFLFNSDEARRPMSNFSGGEKKRLQLAKFLLKPSELMIFDEPSNDLDLESIAILEEELTNFKGPIIIITHDRQLIQNTTNICWQLEDGKLDFFTAGYEQWVQDQEIKTLEKALKLAKPQKTEEAAKKQLPKLSNKDKMRLKKLPQEIEKMEERVMELEEAVESFDGSTQGYEELTKMTSSLEAANAQLQKLYTEQEKFKGYHS